MDALEQFLGVDALGGRIGGRIELMSPLAVPGQYGDSGAATMPPRFHAAEIGVGMDECCWLVDSTISAAG